MGNHFKNPYYLILFFFILIYLSVDDKLIIFNFVNQTIVTRLKLETAHRKIYNCLLITAEKSTQIIFTKTLSFTAKTNKFKNQKQQIQTRFKSK